MMRKKPRRYNFVGKELKHLLLLMHFLSFLGLRKGFHFELIQSCGRRTQNTFESRRVKL